MMSRKILYGIDPDVTVELAGLFAKYRACDETTLHDWLRTPQMQAHLAAAEHRLKRVGLTLDGRRRSEIRQEDRPPSAYVLASYDRQRLYDEVWSEPTRTVAARYGISDVALSKVCRQLRIPKPGRGYWAKKAAGQPVPRHPKLPPLDDAKQTRQRASTKPTQ